MAAHTELNTILRDAAKTPLLRMTALMLQAAAAIEKKPAGQAGKSFQGGSAPTIERRDTLFDSAAGAKIVRLLASAPSHGKRRELNHLKLIRR